MLLIPAIDLKDGECVRLRQGRMDEVTVFSRDPGEVARRWVASGARRLHVVDLEGAFAGAPRNREAVQAILDNAGDVEVEVGGGIRELDVVEELLTLGAHYVVLGSSAVRDPEFVREAARRFPQRIVLGLDARHGLIAIEGWAESTELSAGELLQRFDDAEFAAVVYTDIERDGMMGGLNVEATTALAEQSPFPVIASGGVRTLADLESLMRTEAARSVCERLRPRVPIPTVGDRAKFEGGRLLPGTALDRKTRGRGGQCIRAGAAVELPFHICVGLGHLLQRPLVVGQLEESVYEIVEGVKKVFRNPSPWSRLAQGGGLRSDVPGDDIPPVTEPNVDMARHV